MASQRLLGCAGLRGVITPSMVLIAMFFLPTDCAAVDVPAALLSGIREVRLMLRIDAVGLFGSLIKILFWRPIRLEAMGGKKGRRSGKRFNHIPLWGRAR